MKNEIGNESFCQLLDCLPCGPCYRWDWEKIGTSEAAGWFEKMKQVPQHPLWHGEGNVWIHTKMVCEALVETQEYHLLSRVQQQVLALAALFHDVGKISCTRMEDGIWTSPGHGAAGAQLVRKMFWETFALSGEKRAQQLREAVCLLIRYHTTPLHLVENSDPALRARKLAANGTLVPDFTLDMLCLLARADVMGRICNDRENLLENLELSREAAKEAGCLKGPYEFPSQCTEHAYLSGRKVWAEQKLFDETWGDVILMCGLPGTGKDTWIHQNYPELPMVSLDEIRREMGIKPTENQGKVIRAATEKAREFLREKKSFVWNATSLTPMQRGKQIRLFEEYHAAVKIVYLETDWNENLLRNANRRYAVPESVIGHMLEKLSPPEAAEGRSVSWICL
ncbi:MAG: HD domain-containing protein [Clostridiales bacterium]|nr:HD domain-containing protein [Clostridiales bacterium]